MRNAYRVCLCASAVLLLAALPAAAFEDVYERSFPLRSGGTLSITNVNGSVQVEAWDREEVYLQAVKESKTSPVDESRVQIEVASSADALQVVTRYPKEDGLDVTVEYRVRVPARLLQTHVETVNGNVRVRGLRSRGDLRTVNGDVELLDGAGHLSARSTNGNVRLELDSLGTPAEGDGPITAETINGSIVLELAANVNAALEVLSMNGDFRSEVPVVVQSSSNAGEIRGRMGGGGPLLKIRTVNGAVRIVTAKATV